MTEEENILHGRAVCADGAARAGGSTVRFGARTWQRVTRAARYFGPAFVVSVAYMDPGNFATNISGGSRYGYTLLWVLLWSNAAAILLQTLSAKLGIATGHNLPELCKSVFSKPANYCFWGLAEIAAMATDLAEFLGGTLGLNLLFGLPMLWAGLITAVLTMVICQTEKYGQKTVEAIIGALLAVVGVSYLTEIFLARPDWGAVALHTAIPGVPDGRALLIAVGMLGATVMPHVIYLHSQLVQCRGTDQTPAGRRRHLKMEKLDIFVAMNVAFLVNAAMVIVSAAVFRRNGIAVDTMQQAQASLGPLLGKLSGGVFGVALLASGLSSSAVGTMAGQTILKGFVDLNIPVNVRRLITMAPALIVISCGVNPMEALLLSQVVLSFILPMPVIQLLYLTGRKDLMGEFANRPVTRILGIAASAVIILLNISLLILIFTGKV